ncbi:MAG: PD-(D/E)XK motif protein [Methanobrevibacter ruminantium]|uniref:PD-(D/E)XK motif protein n=1 Tax=Methanobrevibacter ruminantium TaxID=83816 RepID=UPI002D7F765C|nr:PD-(D/E)XK motif protein [Methanobrevibacter ruminantium]MCI5737997.1 PD-(D/E)XK motif protein [Methanobrevibacter ruminantium]
MDGLKIVKALDNIKDKDTLYLIEPITEKTGFFSQDGKLIFIVKDEAGLRPEGIDTEYLKLQTHIKLSSVKNFQTFEDGYYNLIVFNAETSNENIFDFINLCEIYARNEEELSFRDFFYTLISIFQLPSEKMYLNAIGLYGELKFMEYCAKEIDLDISTYWHRNGELSKYDFSNGDNFIEIKSTSNGSEIATIKHKQIFEVSDGYLVLVSTYTDDTGETIDELIESMHKEEKYFKNINFNATLTKELKRVSEVDCQTMRFVVNEIKMFNTKDIDPFDNIPVGITELNYKYDLSECIEIEKGEKISLLNDFVKISK